MCMSVSRASNRFSAAQKANSKRGFSNPGHLLLAPIILSMEVIWRDSLDQPERVKNFPSTISNWTSYFTNAVSSFKPYSTMGCNLHSFFKKKGDELKLRSVWDETMHFTAEVENLFVRMGYQGAYWRRHRIVVGFTSL